MTIDDINSVFISKIIRRYGESNKSPKGRYHCFIPEKIKDIKKWDIVMNVGMGGYIRTMTHGSYYVVVGFLDWWHTDLPLNEDGTEDCFIVLRLFDMNVETVLRKDLLSGIGLNLLNYKL